METYDFVFAGAGCAGLSLVNYLLNSSLKNSKILLIDPLGIQIPNKTWCYWNEKPLAIHPLSSIHFWESLTLKSGPYSLPKAIGALKYFHLNSHDFFNNILATIKDISTITIIQDEVLKLTPSETEVEVITKGGKTIKTSRVFDSRPLDSSLDSSLKQIFVGWRIKTSKSEFDPSQVVLMDFTSESKNFEFFYLLPFSETEALIEYTLYSREIQSEGSLRSKLEAYLNQKFGPMNYEITFRESGVIPMTTQLKPKKIHPRIIPIGTAGGWTKASTGYTFQNIQKNCQKLVPYLESGATTEFQIPRSARFDFYDNILLNIAHRWPNKLQSLFLNLFETSSAEQVLKFLSEETSFTEELKILSKLNFGIFIKSLLRYESH
ncbi:Lycopene beta cyclase [Algoriphagus lacus]|uniref:Lycopene beta cyclase n=1 Tax=Algoriphagus lacus TaxID=2056311 RepID=A0A418PQK8_9BACT|nr:lycopene cyclase family protein [Algoriphagus lacus]RIW14515.1 Lycopene beta cyclase [Algoriphagus lacus]